MKADLHGLSSVDLPAGPPQLPADPADCWIVIDADIGVIGESGADIFTFYVCTPKRLDKILEKEPYQLGRHILVVKRFDWTVVEKAIRNLIGELQAENWNDLAVKIGRHGFWEFEDYQEYRSP